MKLSCRIIVGRRQFFPKLNWQKTKDGWQATIKKNGYSYQVKKELPENKDRVITWHLIVNAPANNRNKIITGKSTEVAMVYSQVEAMAIAELLEARESEAQPYKKGQLKKISVGKEVRFIDDEDWKIGGDNSAYLHGGLCAYQLLRPDNCKKDDPWNLNIMYPGGPDSQDNSEAWELKNIDSLEIGQAIVTLMNGY